MLLGSTVCAMPLTVFDVVIRASRPKIVDEYRFEVGTVIEKVLNDGLFVFPDAHPGSAIHSALVVSGGCGNTKFPLEVPPRVLSVIVYVPTCVAGV